MGMSLPPAAALTLLPTIVPPDKLLLYPFQVTLGCAIFEALAAAFFNTNQCEEFESAMSQEDGGAGK
jgi:hypothetical protein